VIGAVDSTNRLIYFPFQEDIMQIPAQIVGFLALFASGIMAGFFYAYSFSVMWGLDRADPRHAIGSMNGINIAVQNPVFLPFFVGLPLLLIAATVLYIMAGQMPAFWLFAAATLIYIIGAFGITIAINVPMNDELGRIAVPTDLEAARDIWTTYSYRWVPWNHIRTASSALAFALAALGFFMSGR
jgi:uncharacterized membrane protein